PPMLPGTLYRACKAAVESLVHHYGVSGKICAASLRPTSIYGIADPIQQSKWFDIVDSIAKSQPVNAVGGSKSVHADDVAKAVMLLLEQCDAIAGETYNCCDRMISDYEVATIAKRLTHSDSVIRGRTKTAKHEIDTTKIESLGMRFGGTELLEKTIAQMTAKRHG
ncbi:MAG: NAD-dependent epimerase/dehydratase family protein, partial [Planctomycetales bacterium]|nr:NAD-dependent epimerase/dehydratase family protein [Planctomycetales bacterium]